MPRGPGLDFAGALHHVIVRGIERRRIFRGDADRWLFLNRLADWVDSRAGLYAWALMPNHAHLLLRTGQLPLSCLMQAWLSAYSTTFNRRHRRSGHLFQNRLKSTLVEEEPYLRQLAYTIGRYRVWRMCGLTLCVQQWPIHERLGKERGVHL